MNHHVLVLVLLYLVTTLQHVVKAMDVSFIPSDPDGPLPLSSSYRDSLRKLCDIMDKKRPIPPELEAKKAVMKKLCVRLKKDDKNVAAGTTGYVDSSICLSNLISFRLIQSPYAMFRAPFFYSFLPGN